MGNFKNISELRKFRAEEEAKNPKPLQAPPPPPPPQTSNTSSKKKATKKV